MSDTVPIITFNNGIRVPMLGLGTSKFLRNDGKGPILPDLKGTRESVEDAIDIGYRHFDTGYFYQNEKEVGQGIKNMLDKKAVRREDLFITTKLWSIYHHPSHVLKGLRKSLENLQLSYVDCFLIHNPVGLKLTEDQTLGPVDDKGNWMFERTDHVDTWKELEKAVDLGLVRSIGLSNFNMQQIKHILDGCRIKPANLQIENHAYLMQNKLFEFCKQHGITVTAYAPLGSPARLFLDPNDPVLLEDHVVREISQKYNKTPTQILIRYLIDEGRLTVPRSTQKSHLLENFQIFDFIFSPADLQLLNGLDKNIRYFNFDMFRKSPDYPF